MTAPVSKFQSACNTVAGFYEGSKLKKGVTAAFAVASVAAVIIGALAFKDISVFEKLSEKVAISMTSVGAVAVVGTGVVLAMALKGKVVQKPFTLDENRVDDYFTNNKSSKTIPGDNGAPGDDYLAVQQPSPKRPLPPKQRQLPPQETPDKRKLDELYNK